MKCGIFAATFGLCLLFSIPPTSTADVFTEPLARYGLGTGRDIAVTADDSRAFVAGDYGISAWDLTTGEMLAWLVPENRTIQKILLSPDASVVYTIEANYVVQARSTATGHVLRSFTGHTGSVNAMALSYDGTTLVTGSSDKTVKVWNTSTGEVIRTFEEHTAGVYAVDIMRDGARVVSGGGDEVFLWNISNGAILQKYDDFYSDCTLLKFSPGGSKLYLATGYAYYSQILYCFDTFSGNLVRYFDDWYYIQNFFDFDISHDGNGILLDGEWFGRISDEDCRTLYYGRGPTRGRFSSDDSRVISLDCYEGINVVNVATGDISLKCHGFSDGINALSFSPEGSKLLLGSESNQAQLWDMESSLLLKAFPTEDQVSSCAFSPDGTLLAFSSRNNASIFDAATYDLVANVTMDNYITQVEFLPDSKRLMTEDYYRTSVCIWDIASETTTTCIRSTSSPTNGFSLSPNGEQLLQISGEKVNIWDIDSASIVRTLQILRGQIERGCFSPDGNRAALTLRYRDNVLIVDIHTGRILAETFGSSGKEVALSFAPDGNRLLSGRDDGTAHLWNSYTGEELATYQFSPYDSSVNDVAFSPDGIYAITAGHRSPALLWVAAIGIVETPVPSSTPTETVVPTMSPTPSITDTYTFTSTPTSTDTPTETASPTPTLDPVLADIDADGYVDIDDLLHVMQYWHQQVRQETDYTY